MVTIIMECRSYLDGAVVLGKAMIRNRKNKYRTIVTVMEILWYVFISLEEWSKRLKMEERAAIDEFLLSEIAAVKEYASQLRQSPVHRPKEAVCFHGPNCETQIRNHPEIYIGILFVTILYRDSMLSTDELQSIMRLLYQD